MTFTQFAEAHGLIMRELIYGRWVRVPTTDHPRSRNGAYRLFDGFGVVQNWATMSEAAVWHDESSTPAQREEAKVRLAELRRAEWQKERAAILRARHLWDSAPLVRSPHPYIADKGLSQLGCHDLRLDGEALLVPMRLQNGSLLSLQRIWPDGTKRFFYGAPTGRTMYLLRRKDAAMTVLVEGLATGLAVYQSVPSTTVVVCFNAGNMVSVARELKVSGNAVVAADNDHVTLAKRGFNPGIDKGREAAEAIGCGVVWPEGIDGSDWADYLREHAPNGAAAVARLIRAAGRLVIPP